MNQFLKCDEPNCDHHEDVETITEDMIGKPCPKCGANLLTQKDFLDRVGPLEFIKAFEELIEGLSDKLKIKANTSFDELQKMSIKVGTHNSKTTIEIEPVRE